MECDIETLLSEAACFLCVPERQSEAFKILLLCEWENTG